MKKTQTLILCLCFLTIGTLVIYSCSKQTSGKQTSASASPGSSTSSSTSSSVVALVDTCHSCGKTFTGSFSGSGYHFTDQPLNLTCAAANSVIKIACSYGNVNTPTRFSVFDKNSSLVVTSTWLGVANCFGPWGSSLNNPITSATITFNYNTTLKPYKFRVETSIIPGCTGSVDNWSGKVTCVTLVH